MYVQVLECHTQFHRLPAYILLWPFGSIAKKLFIFLTFSLLHTKYKEALLKKGSGSAGLFFNSMREKAILNLLYH